MKANIISLLIATLLTASATATYPLPFCPQISLSSMPALYNLYKPGGLTAEASQKYIKNLTSALSAKGCLSQTAPGRYNPLSATGCTSTKGSSPCGCLKAKMAAWNAKYPKGVKVADFTKPYNANVLRVNFGEKQSQIDLVYYTHKYQCK